MVPAEQEFYVIHKNKKKDSEQTCEDIQSEIQGLMSKKETWTFKYNEEESKGKGTPYDKLKAKLTSHFKKFKSNDFIISEKQITVFGNIKNKDGDDILDLENFFDQVSDLITLQKTEIYNLANDVDASLLEDKLFKKVLKRVLVDMWKTSKDIDVKQQAKNKGVKNKKDKKKKKDSSEDEEEEEKGIEDFNLEVTTYESNFDKKAFVRLYIDNVIKNEEGVFTLIIK